MTSQQQQHESSTALKHSFEAVEEALDKYKSKLQRLEELGRVRSMSTISVPRCSTSYYSSSFYLAPAKLVPVGVDVVVPSNNPFGDFRDRISGEASAESSAQASPIIPVSPQREPATPTSPSSVGHMTWNQYFQAIYEETATDVATKARRLNDFFERFQGACNETVQNFIDKYLDEDRCENIVYASDEDISTGAALRITLLDDTQYKQYQRELRHQFVFLRQQLVVTEQPVVTAFPRLIVHYKGRICLVASQIDATTHHVESDDYVKTVVQNVCEALNLTPTFTEADASGEEVPVAGVQNASFNLCSDGRCYMKSMLNLLPHFPPSRGTVLKPDEHTLFLNSSVVANFRVPLCPGSFQMHGTRESITLNKSTRECISDLCQNAIPTLISEALLTADEKAPQTNAEIVAEMHVLGINVGLLALVYDAARKRAGGTSTIATRLLTEIACRAAKELLRSRMQRRLEVDEITEEIGELCSKLCNEETRHKAWVQDLVPVMCRKFTGFATLLAPAPQPKDIDLALFLERLQELMGFTFAPGVSPAGASAYHFSVMSLSPVSKTPTFSFPAIGPLVVSNSGTKLVPASTQIKRRGTAVVYGRRVSPVLLDPATSERFATNPGIRMQAVRFQFIADPTMDHAAAYYAARKRQSGGSHQLMNYVTALDIAQVFRRRKLYDLSQTYLDRAGRILVDAERLHRAMTAPLTMGGGAFSQPRRGADAVRGGGNDEEDTDNHTSKSVMFQAFYFAERGMLAAARSHFHETVKNLNAAIKLFEKLDAKFEEHSHLSVAALPFAAVLAQAYEERGLIEEAEPLHRQILDGYRHAKGRSSLSVCAALNNLAINLYQQENYDEAEELYLEDLRITEAVLGVDDIGCASSLNNLACLYDKQERYDESIDMHNRDIALSERVLGTDHPDVATSRNNLAAALMKQNRYPEALTEYQKALETRKKCYGEQHVSVAETLNNIAALKREQGSLPEAKQLWEKALHVYERTLGRHHFKLRQCLDNLQQLSEDLGLDEDAERYMEWLMDLKRADNDVYNVQQEAIKGK